ncbi:MAG: M67 family metallopeptidase [Huintestinicola sp.]
MIKLKKSDFDRIAAHALRELPNEACGLIGGEITHEGKAVKEVYFLTNTDASEEHFSMDPKEQLAAVRDMRSKGYVPLGSWHSHPASPSCPSDEDKRLAYDSNASCMIISLMDRNEPVLNSFRITGSDPKASEREELIIEE